jgi:hypothetical protein
VAIEPRAEIPQFGEIEEVINRLIELKGIESRSILHFGII